MFPLDLINFLYSVSILSIASNHIYSVTSPHPPVAKVCMLHNSFEPDFVVKGDYVIGGIFPLHYNQEMPDINSTYRPPPVKCNG